MKTHLKWRSAFTLIEMLTVIAIIAFLATALLTGLRSAQRQAYTALCQARMKNLHQACMNYLSDLHSEGGTFDPNGDHFYPFAGSYEWYDTVGRTFHERKGWVAWIRADGKTDRSGNPKNPWAEDASKSYAKDYLHAGWMGPAAGRSIKEGTIFTYATRDAATYFCRSFNNGKGDVRRSYAMNAWFGSRRSEIRRGRRLLDFQNAGIEPSRMGYLIELKDSKEPNKWKGEQGGKDVTKRKPIAGDSVWEHGDDERYGLYHRKSGGMHGHVIFVDGHIESLTDQDYETQNEKIGNGTH